MKVEEPEVDRAVQNIAQQNQISLDVLRQRLRDEGLDYGRFRANLRDQLMIERLREREVYQRIKISDEELDKVIEQQRQADAWWAGVLAKILAPAAPSPWLEKERKPFADALAMARPKVLVLAGGTAAKSVLDTTEGIMRLRGKWTNLSLDDGSTVPTLPTFHPAYLLRTPASKRQSWSDLLSLDKKLRELGIR